MMKKKFTVYLNDKLAKDVEKLAEENHFYVSQMIAVIVQSYLSQRAQNKISHHTDHGNNALQSDRYQVDIRLLEMGVEGCLLNRKVLEKCCQSPEDYQKTIHAIKQESIQFVQQLSAKLKR